MSSLARVDVPAHLGVVNQSKIAHDDQVILWTDGARIHMRNVAAAWGEKPPGVFIYDRDADLIGGMAVVSIVDKDGDPDALGYHSQLGGHPYGVVDMGQAVEPWEVLAHELSELFADQHVDRYAPSLLHPGLRYLVETQDPTQGRSYNVTVDRFGVRAVLKMPDFVLPAWFTGEPGPTTFCESTGALPRLEPNQIAPGGYQIAVDGGGDTHYLGPEGPSERVAAIVAEKVRIRPSSRTAQHARKR